MRGRSHYSLGIYLSQRYLHGFPPRYVRAFLFGCIEPDRNPITYLKGSIRCQWFRGHNYENARKFMRSISRRLERKDSLNLWDYYTLGKLIHYTADAFTYAHNAAFPTRLADHREYEAELQNHFLRYLQEDPQVDIQLARTIMDAIYTIHREYEQQRGDLLRDSQFALQACCCVLALLFTQPIL